MAVLTIQRKCELCTAAARYNLSPTAVVAWAARAFNLSKPISLSTAQRTLRSHNELARVPPEKRMGKKTAGAAFAQYDDQLRAAFDGMANKVETISGGMIIRLAKQVADRMGIPPDGQPRISNGWLYKFQRRHRIELRVKHGEAASVADEVIHAGRQSMLALTASYPRRNTYNMDETALYVNQVSGRALSRRKKVAGHKKPKDRLTMCLAVNADGTDKLSPLFIGTAKNPRALEGHNVEHELEVKYTNSRKGWMNSSIFLEWLHELDERMREEGRHILLLVDNVSSHVRPTAKLTNVRLEFLPKNTTSVIQPLDQGVISCVKRKYYDIKADFQFDQYLAGKAPDKTHPCKIDIWQGMQWVKQAWDRMTVDSIQNCWHHAGILWDRRDIHGLLNPSS